MGFKSFRFNVIVRVASLAATILGLILLFLHTSFYATVVVLAVLVLLQFFSLIQYVERTNDEVTRFLRSIRYSDFSSTFPGRKSGRAFDDLHAAFNEVMDQFRHTRSQAEEQALFLETVVQHIGVGLISFMPDGEVGLINAAAKRTLRINHLTNINALASLSKDLADTLRTLKTGEKHLVKIDQEHETLQLAVYATELRLRNQHYTLVSLQNIRSELEEKEMEAWQNLIRVLTHEIMNSITPISSLASTVNDMLDATTAERGKTMDGETIEDIRGALQTIEKRSQGLLHFVDAYRNLTRIPRPSLRVVRASELFNRVEQLMRTQLAAKHVGFHTRINPSSLEFPADPELLEQVLINLIMNAIHAMNGQPDAEINMTAGIDDHGRAMLEVIDNGPGIPKDLQDRVFIPFFTTKKDGSGIGLSLSRQIMRMHGGTIYVRSTPGVQTVFTLKL